MAVETGIYFHWFPIEHSTEHARRVELRRFHTSYTKFSFSLKQGERKAKQNIKRSEAAQSKTKQSKAKQSHTKQGKTKHNKQNHAKHREAKQGKARRTQNYRTGGPHMCKPYKDFHHFTAQYSRKHGAGFHGMRYGMVV